MPEPITVVSLLSAAALAVKAAFDWGAHVAHSRAHQAQAAAQEHTAEVTEREGWRKRTTSLETQVAKLTEQIATMYADRERFRDEKFALQDHVLQLQTQIQKLSEQLAVASAREAGLRSQITELTVELVALRVELQKYKDGEPHGQG